MAAQASAHAELLSIFAEYCKRQPVPDGACALQMSKAGYLSFAADCRLLDQVHS